MRSKMDTTHITQSTYQEDLEAVRVHLLPTEMEFDTHEMTVHEIKAGDILDTSKAVKMNVIADSPVSVNMVILEQVISLGDKSGISEICSPALKFDEDCIVVLQG